MRLFKKRKSSIQPPYLYDDTEIDLLEHFISEQYGSFEHVFHEIVSPDLHIDIAIIEPNEQDDFYKLITMGMGAYPMHIPKEFEQRKLEFAELVVYLPKDWNIYSSDENDYWPIRWLKMLARMPYDAQTWLGYGHTIAAGEHHETLSDQTRFEGVGLVTSQDQQGNDRIVMLSENKMVRFYQMVPLYGEEMDEKNRIGDIESIIRLFMKNNQSYIVDIHRENYLK